MATHRVRHRWVDADGVVHVENRDKPVGNGGPAYAGRGNGNSIALPVGHMDPGSRTPLKNVSRIKHDRRGVKVPG